MKKLTALLLALTLTLSLASCTPDDPAPSPDPASQPPDPSDLAETYITELRSIFDAAGVDGFVADPDDADPFRPGTTYADTRHTVSGDSQTLEYASLTYSEININADTYNIAAALYNAVCALHGEAVAESDTLATELFSRGSIPEDSAYCSANWQLPDRRLTLSVRYTYGTYPPSVELTLTLRPAAAIPAPVGTPSTAP